MSNMDFKLNITSMDTLNIEDVLPSLTEINIVGNDHTLYICY